MLMSKASSNDSRIIGKRCQIYIFREHRNLHVGLQGSSWNLSENRPRCFAG